MDLDSTSDTNASTVHQPAALAVGQTVRLVVGWLLGFLALTEAEQLKAGIYLGGMD